jgi:triosephosphate isomerase
MYKTPAEAEALARAVIEGVAGVKDVEVVLCPPYVALATVAAATRGTAVKLGAQNCHYEKEGAFTGEVAAPMLAAAGCSYVIVGHSERRQYFGETDELINRKVRAALNAGLKPIICVGESLAHREAGEGWKELVAGQAEAALAGVPAAAMGAVVLAYEPVWAIGTGKTASPGQAAEAHALLRQRVARLYGDGVAAAGRILYGGSVKPDNVKTLMAEEDIDGALVGGASLKAETFLPLVRFGL